MVLYLELGNVNKLKFFKGNKGLIMVQTKKYILLGTYKENMYPSVCVEAIEKLGDFDFNLYYLYYLFLKYLIVCFNFSRLF